jgi:hypothetical protein
VKPEAARPAASAPSTAATAVAAEPDRPAAPPATTRVAAPPLLGVREDRSGGTAGDTLPPVGHADSPLPWPLSAAAARPGGIGLLAAALGLFVVGVVKRRARAAPIAAALETCEIAISHAEGDGNFYAQAVGPGGKGYVAARSMLFRWNGGDTPPDNAAVRAAHGVLVQRLAWDGWRREERQDRAWWRASFSRPAGGSVEVSDGR